MRTVLACLGLIVAAIVAAEEAEDSNAGLPPKYADTYLIAEKTRSPNGAFAVIYPTHSAAEAVAEGEIKDYLVALKPFRILTKIDTQMPYFERRNHASGIEAQWSPDSSVALVVNGGRWGPNDILVYQIAGGKVAHTTNLLAKMHGALVDDFRAAHIRPYNDFFDFVFNDDSEDAADASTGANSGQCTLDGGDRIRIHASATTDPKGIPGVRAWDARLEGYWDVRAGKFTDLKVTRKFAGTRPE